MIDNNYDLAYKTYFNIFLKSEISINGLNISIENSFKELSIKNSEKGRNISKSELHEMNSLFKEIKKKFCIICFNELTNQNYEIPCGCNFCSVEHVKKYFHLKNKIDNLYYVCVCSYEYSVSDLYNLGLYFIKNRLFSLKNDIIDLINNNLSRQCCFCSISFEESDGIRIKYKDLENNIRNNLILGDCSQIRHYMCDSCFAEYNTSVKFFCNICKKEHIYIPRRY